MNTAHPRLNFSTAEITGATVHEKRCTVADMQGYYRDEPARQHLDPGKLVYRVQAWLPAPEGQEGGLFLGTTLIEPGRVGDEYFMTKGHFHLNRNRSEFYITAAGSGALILMDENGRTVFEPMRPGSIHYIPFHCAHRVANTGDSLLSFLACWPSDAGHDYGTIASRGFSARLRNINGTPALVEVA